MTEEKMPGVPRDSRAPDDPANAASDEISDLLEKALGAANLESMTLRYRSGLRLTARFPDRSERHC